MKTHTEWRYSSTILDLGTRWRWVVNFMPWPLTTQENCLWHILDRRLGGPQGRSGCSEERNVTLAANQTSTIQPVAHHCTDWAYHLFLTDQVKTELNIRQIPFSHISFSCMCPLSHYSIPPLFYLFTIIIFYALQGILSPSILICVINFSLFVPSDLAKCLGFRFSG
jgi:hypothetical protein